jgi:hypothetical protein
VNGECVKRKMISKWLPGLSNDDRKSMKPATPFRRLLRQNALVQETIYYLKLMKIISIRLSCLKVIDNVGQDVQVVVDVIKGLNPWQPRLSPVGEQ